VLYKSTRPNRDLYIGLYLGEGLQGVTEIELKTTISETIDLLCKTNKNNELIEGIRLLKTYLQRKINEATKEDFLDKNKIL
jgi:hypothetical protein